MKYLDFDFHKDIREQESLRNSFYELTQKVMCFDLKEWYEKGYWEEKYIPYVLADKGKIISCVAASIMKFQVDGEIKSYIQIGTVMTDPEYRGMGLNRFLLERVIEDYKGKTEGFYLFANDSAVTYYPKFGFKSGKEYTYSLFTKNNNIDINRNEKKYHISQTDCNNKKELERLTETMEELCNSVKYSNENDGFFVFENTGLFFFHFLSEYDSHIYYIDETNSYVVATMEGSVLFIHQIFSKVKVDIPMLAATFSDMFKKEVTEIRFDYTPKYRENMDVTEHKVEDSTLFLLGESLDILEEKKLRFSKFSHA